MRALFCAADNVESEASNEMSDEQILAALSMQEVPRAHSTPASSRRARDSDSSVLPPRPRVDTSVGPNLQALNVQNRVEPQSEAKVRDALADDTVRKGLGRSSWESVGGGGRRRCRLLLREASARQPSSAALASDLWDPFGGIDWYWWDPSRISERLDLLLLLG